MDEALRIRPARPADASALRDMQALSLRALGANVYTREVIETYLTEVGTLDDHLLHDGRYYVATLRGALVGCGGWSVRPAAYDSRASRTLKRGSGGATVRAVYVHPDAARRGIGRSIMAQVEAEMAGAGFAHSELHATLSGVQFYRQLRYAAGGKLALRLSGGRALEVIEMRKALSVEVSTAA